MHSPTYLRAASVLHPLTTSYSLNLSFYADAHTALLHLLLCNLQQKNICSNCNIADSQFLQRHHKTCADCRERRVCERFDSRLAAVRLCAMVGPIMREWI